MIYGLLDLDNTIVATEKLILLPFLELLQNDYGISVSEETFYLTYNGKGGKELYRAIIADLPESSTIEIDLDELFEKQMQLNEHILETDTVELSPGITDFLHKQKELGVIFSIVTNSSHEETLKKLEKTAHPEILYDFFENRIFSAADANKQKPDPYIYIEAQKLLGVTKDDIVFAVEDSASGVVSAHKAGLPHIFGYTGLVHPAVLDGVTTRLKEKGCTRILKHWDDFKLG